ncbi:hypothetical protein Tco_0536797 [Tanacetum coccineum]
MADKEKKSTMKGFATNDQADYYLGITSITINGKNAYELKGKFLDDLHNNAFSGTNWEDAVEHIEYFLKIVDLIDLPNVNQDKLKVVVFPISLVGDAWRWFDRIKGSITRAYIIRNMLRYQDLEWYDALKDSKLKEEALRNKAIMEGLINKDVESNNEGWKSWDDFKITNCDRNEWEYENEHEDDERYELCDKKYVAVKEDEYEDLMSTSKDECQAYEEIFCMMDEGWMERQLSNYGVLGERRYGVSVPALTKDHEGNKIQYAVSRRRQYAVFKLYGNKIFWKISNVVPTPRNPQYAVSKTLDTPMDDPNIAMKEYIRLEEEKAQKCGKEFNWETAKYGRILYDEDVHDLISVENEFPAIIFNDSLTSNETLSCEPTVSSLNDEIDCIISFDDSDDEDYMVVFDKNSFSYKIISTNDLKMDSENDNEKVNKPLFPSPEPTVSCIDDLDFFKEFENGFPAIIYNDALTSKSDFSTEPTLCPQHIDEFDWKDETSLSEYDEVEQSVLYFNDLFPFNIVYPDNQKSDKGNDENEINMIQSLRGNENTSKLLKESHDKIKKVFIMGSFIMGLNVNIVAWNHFVNGMLFNLIKNLYVLFGIPFDPKRYYKDGDCARMLQRPRIRDEMRVVISTMDLDGVTCLNW